MSCLIFESNFLKISARQGAKPKNAEGVSPCEQYQVIPSISPSNPLAGLSRTFPPHSAVSKRKRKQTAQINFIQQKTTENRTIRNPLNNY